MKGNDRIVKRIARKEGHDFDHGRVAAYFLMNQNDEIDRLSTVTLGRFEALIEALSNALPSVPRAD